MKVKKSIQKNLITPAQYATLTGLSRLTVWNHIHAGKIEVILVGMSSDPYIDYSIYKDHPFDITKRNTKAEKAPF